MSVTLKTTVGSLKVELFCDEAPKACRNFLGLAASGSYDGVAFHRVIRGFMGQSGDPTGTGKGGESIYGKPFNDEFVERLKFDRRGLLAMANKGPNTNGSQFFITFDKCPHLNNMNTIFGHIIHGIEVLDNIEIGEVDKKNRPKNPVKIESIHIHANPFAEKEG